MLIVTKSLRLSSIIANCHKKWTSRGLSKWLYGFQFIEVFIKAEISHQTLNYYILF